MATFTFNKTQLAQFKRFREAKPNSEVWFQPTHHGGCLQVVENNHGDNTFCTRRTGYQNFCNKTILIQDAIKLLYNWIEMILESKSVKFKVNVKSENGKKHIEFDMTVKREVN